MFKDCNYMFHKERNWPVLLRVTKVIKITKADFYPGTSIGVSDWVQV